MAEITDEIVDAALAGLLAFARAKQGIHGPDKDMTVERAKAEIPEMVPAMRAIIAAVAPMIGAPAYERGRRDMRERAAGVAENCIWASTVRLHATKKEVSARSCYEVAAAIRALPTDRGEG